MAEVTGRVRSWWRRRRRTRSAYTMTSTANPTRVTFTPTGLSAKTGRLSLEPLDLRREKP